MCMHCSFARSTPFHIQCSSSHASLKAATKLDRAHMPPPNSLQDCSKKLLLAMGVTQISHNFNRSSNAQPSLVLSKWQGLSYTEGHYQINTWGHWAIPTFRVPQESVFTACLYPHLLTCILHACTPKCIIQIAEQYPGRYPRMFSRR